MNSNIPGLKNVILFVITLFGVLNIKAANHAELLWLSKEYDFGIIDESAGPVKGEIKFINNNKKKVEIENVVPGCGCTEADFTKGKIAKGDTAVISFVYDPADRPGRFEKDIKVYLKNEQMPFRISIKGTVKASDSTLEYQYPYSIDHLKLETKVINGGEFKKRGTRYLYLYVYNSSGNPLDIKINIDDEFIKLKRTNFIINPYEEETIEFILDTTTETRKGLIEYPLKFTVMELDHNDNGNGDNLIPVEGIVTVTALLPSQNSILNK